MGYIQRIATYKEGRACEAGESVVAKSDLDQSSPKSEDLQTCFSKVLGSSSYRTPESVDARGCQTYLKEVQEIPEAQRINGGL